MSRARGVLAARSISKSFGDAVVLDRVSLAVTPGSRTGVVGPNGIGKSTLLRVLAGLDSPDSGAVSREPPGLAVAYLAQESEPAWRSGGEAARAKLEAILASDADVLLLAKFALGTDHVRRSARSLSPGERSRATLALLAARGVNALVLDEPTNHLDLEAITELESALESFEGTVVLVTHDRRFLDAFRATRTLEL